MYHPYLQEQVARAHYQELVREAEQQRLLQQLPRRHPRLLQVIIAGWNALLTALLRLPEQVEPHMRTTTGEL